MYIRFIGSRVKRTKYGFDVAQPPFSPSHPTTYSGHRATVGELVEPSRGEVELNRATGEIADIHVPLIFDSNFFLQK